MYTKTSGRTWRNVLREFPVSSEHVCVQYVHKNIREDMEDRWVTNLSEDRKRFYLVSSLLDPHTKMLVKDSDGQVKYRSDLDELLGMSTTSMDFDVVTVEGESQFQAYVQVQQVPNDTDPLMWWKQYHQEFPDFVRMTRQSLTVPATSVSPERFFSRVGLVQTDFLGSLLDTTMIDLMWTTQVP
jgi:hypothetical protein